MMLVVPQTSCHLPFNCHLCVHPLCLTPSQARDLGAARNKLRASEDRHASAAKAQQVEREALQRQIKELKRAQLQSEHTARRRDGEAELLQRKLRTSASLGGGGSSGGAQQQQQQQPGASRGGPRREEVAAGSECAELQDSYASGANGQSRARRVTVPYSNTSVDAVSQVCLIANAITILIILIPAPSRYTLPASPTLDAVLHTL